jgi:ABC-type nitrate/sulfonate/bicarbonate transport system permease component
MQILRKKKNKKQNCKRPLRSFFLLIPTHKIFLLILLITALLIIWEISFNHFDIPQRIAPKPSDLVEFIQKEFFTTHSQKYQNILTKSLYSLKDAGIGFIISLLLGCILGITISQNETLYCILFPFLFLTQLIPVPALAPLVAAFLGYGTITKIFIIVLFNIFPVTVSVRKTVLNLPENYKMLFYSYSKKSKDFFRYLILPSLVPTLFSNMKILCTSSIVASIITELPLSVRHGIGKDIYNSFNNLLIPRVWVSIMLISLLSLIFFTIVSFLEKYINRKYKYGQF